MTLAEILKQTGVKLIRCRENRFYDIKGTEEAIKKVCRMAHKYNWQITVYLDKHDELNYQITMKRPHLVDIKDIEKEYENQRID
jgi:hypothetical protein